MGLLILVHDSNQNVNALTHKSSSILPELLLLNISKKLLEKSSFKQASIIKNVRSPNSFNGFRPLKSKNFFPNFSFYYFLSIPFLSNLFTFYKRIKRSKKLNPDSRKTYNWIVKLNQI